MKFNRVNIILTHRCNLNCKHCYINAVCNLNEDSNKIFVKSMELLKKLLENNITEVMFTGGECTLFPYITKLIEYAKEIGFKKVDIFTNGMILNKDLLNLVDTCYLSLDGLEKTHNFIRGNENSFKNLFSTLDYLREIDKKTYLQFTVNDKNIDDLCNISKILINYLNVRKVKIVNQSNEGRALNSDLNPIDLMRVKEIMPMLYQNTKYHIQFLYDLWTKYDVENYYLSSQIKLPIWFDLVDNNYYVYSKDCFVKNLDELDFNELIEQLDIFILKIKNHFANKLGQQLIDVESEISDLYMKED